MYVHIIYLAIHKECFNSSMVCKQQLIWYYGILETDSEFFILL